MSSDLTGKIVLLTGATEGIGKAAALDFARRGATLTLVGRDPDKTARVVAEIAAATGNPALDSILCDLASLADVRRAVATFRAQHDRLDILALNAGAMLPKPRLGVDGFELTFTINHLAPFQLATGLLDLIRATPGARVVTTASAMQARGKLDLVRTSTALAVSGPTAYATSKLANILFTTELQRRLEGTTAVANCLLPGIVRSRFGAFGNGFGPLLRLIFALCCRSRKRRPRTPIHCSGWRPRRRRAPCAVPMSRTAG